jgi:hypothetical protein
MLLQVVANMLKPKHHILEVEKERVSNFVQRAFFFWGGPWSYKRLVKRYIEQL